MKSVAVTMFFDLKSLPDATSAVRPVEFYVENGRTTLSTKSPMVIFCDENTKDWIEKIRNEVCPEEKTIYVVNKITNYDLYKMNHSIIKENRSKSSGYKGEGERNTPSYCITTTFKFLAIQIASQIIDSDILEGQSVTQGQSVSHFVWLDFGCNHIAREAPEFIPKMMENPHPKVSCAYIHYRPSHKLRDMKSYLENGNPCGLAATVFTVQKEYVNLLYTRAMSIFYEMLSKGVGHNEEACLVYLYDRYPEMFTLYYGDYYSSICNYHDIRMDYQNIKKYFIEETMSNHNYKLAKECAAKVIESFEKGKLSLSEEEIIYLKSI